jgi:hypothetical protein
MQSNLNFVKLCEKFLWALERAENIATLILLTQTTLINSTGRKTTLCLKTMVLQYFLYVALKNVE